MKPFAVQLKYAVMMECLDKSAQGRKPFDIGQNIVIAVEKWC